MFPVLVFVLLCTSSLADLSKYSFSPSVGPGSGTSFSTETGGRITGIRVWERSNSFITGLQLRYDYAWQPVVGHIFGTPQELELFDGESIVQVSGKFSTAYIVQVYFLTSRNRFLVAGQPIQMSFNMYPKKDGAELIKLSGRFNTAGITSLASHWGVFVVNNNNTMNDESSH